jgi:hypothetical protein
LAFLMEMSMEPSQAFPMRAKALFAPASTTAMFMASLSSCAFFSAAATAAWA